MIFKKNDMDNKDKLIKIYEEYIKLLAEEIHEFTSLATVHGWKSSRIEKGIKLRKKIYHLKKLLKNGKLFSL